MHHAIGMAAEAAAARQGMLASRASQRRSTRARRLAEACHAPPHPLLHRLLLPRQIKYSHLISGLRDENVQLNRKMLSELAMYEPHSFKALVEQVQFMRGRPGLNGADAGLSSRISVGSLPLPPPQQQQQLESGGGHSSSSSRGGAGSSNSSGLGVS